VVQSWRIALPPCMQVLITARPLPCSSRRAPPLSPQVVQSWRTASQVREVPLMSCLACTRSPRRLVQYVECH